MSLRIENKLLLAGTPIEIFNSVDYDHISYLTVINQSSSDLCISSEPTIDNIRNGILLKAESQEPFVINENGYGKVFSGLKDCVGKLYGYCENEVYITLIINEYKTK